jgi:hypothetical protein
MSTRQMYKPGVQIGVPTKCSKPGVQNRCSKPGVQNQVFKTRCSKPGVQNQVFKNRCPNLVCKTCEKHVSTKTTFLYVAIYLLHVPSRVLHVLCTHLQKLDQDPLIWFLGIRTRQFFSRGSGPANFFRGDQDPPIFFEGIRTRQFFSKGSGPAN